MEAAQRQIASLTKKDGRLQLRVSSCVQTIKVLRDDSDAKAKEIKSLRGRLQTSAAVEAVRSPVVVRGVEYPSGKAAADALGVTPQTISYHLNFHGHADFVGAPSGLRENIKPAAKPIEWNGYSFPSTTEAARQIGVKRDVLRRFLEGKVSQKVREHVIGRLMEATA